MVMLPAVRYAVDGYRLIIEIPARYRDMIKAQLKQCAAGYIKAVISKPGKPRTTGDNSQSNHINGHVQQIAAETGNDFDMVKMAAKMQAVSMGYPFRTLAGAVVPYSEKEIDTVAAGLLIEALHLIAAELSINLIEGEL